LTVREEDCGSVSRTMAGRGRLRIVLIMTATGSSLAASDARRVAPRSGDAQVLGSLLILGGVFWLLQRSGVVELSWRGALSVLLVVLGVGMVITARRGGNVGLIVLGAVMTLVLVSTSSIDIGVLNDGVGQRVLSPMTVAAAQRENALGVGELQIDLRELALPDGETELKYTMGVGELDITLPASTEDVAVRVRATMQGGELDVLDKHRTGGSLSVRAEDRGYDTAAKKLDIVVTMGFGNLQVARAPF